MMIAPFDDGKLLRLALDGAEQGIFFYDVDRDSVSWDARTSRIYGFERAAASMSMEEMLLLMHVEDLPEIRAGIGGALDPEGDGIYRLDHRIRTVDGSIRWIAAHARTEFTGETPDRRPHSMRGVVRDITAARDAERQRALLAAELDHRVRNLLATVQAMASQCLRHASEPERFHTSFMGRLQAMAAAHGVLTTVNRPSGRLRDLVEEQLRPFGGDNAGRVRINGPDVVLDGPATHALGLALHELASNASRFGALSSATGCVCLEWGVETEPECTVRIEWREIGGPVARTPPREGFGARLIRHSLEHALGGSAVVAYLAEGLSATLRLPHIRH